MEFTIKTASINTDNADRDKHLKSPDFFDVEKNPEITFKSSKVTPAGKDKYNVDGTLTLRGVSKPVTLPVEFQGFVKDPWGNEKAGFCGGDHPQPQGLRHGLEQGPRPGRLSPGRRRQGRDQPRGGQEEVSPEVEAPIPA